MALSFKGTVDASGAASASTITPMAEDIDTAAVTAAAAAFESDEDVLVADGATPTEAHVTDALATWAVLEPLLAALALDGTATQDALDVLEADAETPTEAHVQDLTAAWATLEVQVAAAVAAYDARGLLNSADGVVVAIDTSVITTVSKLRKAFNAIEVAALGSGQLTP